MWHLTGFSGVRASFHPVIRMYINIIKRCTGENNGIMGSLSISYTSSPLIYSGTTLSAVDYEQMFLVGYRGAKNRFALHETNLSLTEPLLNATIEGETVPPSIVDPLALEIEHLVGDKVWVSPGSGKTAYNFYVPSERGDAIVMGIFEDGRIWSDFKGLGEEISNRLVHELSSIGIILDGSKEWQFWRKDDRLLILVNNDPRDIARKVVAALYPDTPQQNL